MAIWPMWAFSYCTHVEKKAFGLPIWMDIMIGESFYERFYNLNPMKQKKASKMEAFSLKKL